MKLAWVARGAWCIARVSAEQWLKVRDAVLDIPFGSRAYDSRIGAVAVRESFQAQIDEAVRKL